MKKFLLICICGGLICCSACSKKTSEPAPETPSSQEAVADTPSPVAPPDSAENSDKSNAEVKAGVLEVVNHDSEKKVEKMTFSMKTQTYGVEKIDTRLAQAVNALVASEIGEFNDAFGDDPDAQMNVTIQQETVRANKNGVDVVFKLDRYVEGAAHPSGDVFTFMFNPETGEEISVASLFDSGALDREKLASQCLEPVMTVLEDNELKNAVEQSLKDNAFEHVVRTDTGYKVFFAPEEILGPYRQIIEINVDVK